MCCEVLFLIFFFIVSRCTKFVFQNRYELEVIYILILPWPKEGFAGLPKTIEEEELCVEKAVLKLLSLPNIKISRQ